MLVDCCVGELPADAVEAGRRRGFDTDYAYWDQLITLMTVTSLFFFSATQYIYFVLECIHASRLNECD